ncbi:hypothetical protein QBC35DRAFT_478302 [Podospora australis]|uniref:Uncharacterized protein n=1 Tax=Podospora australis TaxID=1536484 RepID=A0AAN6WK32_9PEZI|nr:hypothetical protein QBC35DRAFT_478302 [Podospora australis]
MKCDLGQLSQCCIWKLLTSSDELNVTSRDSEDNRGTPKGYARDKTLSKSAPQTPRHKLRDKPCPDARGLGRPQFRERWLKTGSSFGADDGDMFSYVDGYSSWWWRRKNNTRTGPDGDPGGHHVDEPGGLFGSRIYADIWDVGSERTPAGVLRILRPSGFGQVLRTNSQVSAPRSVAYYLDRHCCRRWDAEERKRASRLREKVMRGHRDGS